ncbi:hypothetical protein [Methylobacterium nonmethylotrophicum]|uniref:Uncharacterized protein n=1 Tax=Methylobacterium nonmethylotrophicum TaxID=1141884 RepID=A0A4Z0NE24_9HYPH|nr:hypothetical protein [Methylobacterium nonmethylotrophicum]TGD94060.1 hypothetical protein EU555_32585 [Methylobacterium nonmethylotrophicum]
MATNVAPVQPSAREYREQELHYVRKTVSFSDAAFTMPASLPAGALITRTLILVETAFTGGTSPSLTLGTTVGGTDLVAAADSVAGTAGAKRPDTASVKGRLAVDTPIYGAVNGGPTAGVATIVFEYAPNNDG